MRDEQIGHLDLTPEIIPHPLLSTTLLTDQITSNLDMAAEDDGDIRSNLFGNLDKTRHLRVVDDNHVCARLAERTSFAGPVLLRVVVEPTLPSMNVFLLQSHFRIGDALQNVVVILGNSEDGWVWFRDVPDVNN